MQWDPNDANIEVDAPSNSGEESKEHDSDDVNFYLDIKPDGDGQIDWKEG